MNPLFHLALGIAGGSLFAVPTWAADSIWSHDNIHAWSVAPFDANKRTPEERGDMLLRLGLKHYAYSWRDVHIPTFEAEIVAMKKRGIDFVGWNLISVEIDDAPAKASLEAFRRQGIHPTIWIMHTSRGRPKTMTEWKKLLPPEDARFLPATSEEIPKLPPLEREQGQAAMKKATRRLQENSFTHSPAEQKARVSQEADRIK